MQNPNAAGMAPPPDSDQERDLTAKYPAVNNYMNGRAAARPKGKRWLERSLLLAGAAVLALSLSWLSITIYAEPDQVDVVDINNQYPDVSERVKRLAERLKLTASGKKLFYDHDPVIFNSADDPGFACNKELNIDWRIVIRGCWSAKDHKIYLLGDDLLETTAAHELLHAVYYDLYIHGGHEQINRHIDDVYNQNAEDLRDFIGIYNDLSDGGNDEFNNLNRYNELHSFIGSQIKDIPEELEEHYGLWFEDRTVITSFFEDNAPESPR